MTGPARLGNDTLDLVHLALSTAKGTELPCTLVGRGKEEATVELTRFFASLRARLSLLLRRSSRMRRSYGARLQAGQYGSTAMLAWPASPETYPATSLTMSRTNDVRLLDRPGRGFLDRHKVSHGPSVCHRAWTRFAEILQGVRRWASYIAFVQTLQKLAFSKREVESRRRTKAIPDRGAPSLDGAIVVVVDGRLCSCADDGGISIFGSVGKSEMWVVRARSMTYPY